MSVAVPEPLAVSYLDVFGAVLGRAKAANRDSLRAAARLVADVVAGNGIVYVFGSGHSQLAALDVNRRAGSIAPLQVIFDPMWGLSELVEGYGRTLLSEIAFGRADCLIVVSNSGTTAAPIEIALAARAAGTPVIAVTAVEVSKVSKPRHSSGKRLWQIGDIVLDNGGVGADVAIRVDALGVGPTSTLVAAALLHEVIVEAIFALAARGMEPPIYLANTDEGGPEHNARLRDRYRGRLKTVP
jgi:uncharacterized phosphosugar-binding protein